MNEEHKQKLRDAYNRRKQAKEKGIHLPTQKEIREAARTKKEIIDEQSVNQLIKEAPVTEQESRVNGVVTRFTTSPGIKPLLRAKMCLSAR